MSKSPSETSYSRPEMKPSLCDIDTPALLIDKAALEDNIRAMRDLCEDFPARLRPHTKTHKSPLIAKLQQSDAAGVCCAKLGEAERFASAGLDDIMVTTPLVGRLKLERLAALMPSVKITLVADNPIAIAPLADVARSAGRVLDIVVEVDVGQGRCGVPPGVAATAMAQEISRHASLRFAGLQGYQGKLQGLISYEERRRGVKEALERLQISADGVRRAGFDIAVLTGGGSGTVAIDLELGVLNELQPGSYVFMDASYMRIGWDAGGKPPPFRPALTVLTTVTSTPSADRVVVDAGWKSISCDSGPPIVKNRPDLTFEFAGDEHGIVRASAAPLDLRLGDMLELVPSHSDTTVNLHDRYVVVRADHVEEVWDVATRGLSF